MTDPTLDVKALVRDLIDACIDYGCTEQGDEETEAEQRMVKANSALLTRITAQAERNQALERTIVTIYYEVVMGLTVQSTARLANIGSEFERQIIEMLGGTDALMTLLEKYRSEVKPSWRTVEQPASSEGA